MAEKWTLEGQGSESWFGNNDQLFADSEDKLREMFRDCVEGDWSNGCSDQDGCPEPKQDAIARLWEKFDDLLTEVIVCDFCGETIEHSDYKTRHGKDVCNYECLQGLYLDEIPESEDFVSVKL
jgi:hypothetical protein